VLDCISPTKSLNLKPYTDKRVEKVKIAKPFVNQNPIDALIEKCFNDNVKFTVLANEHLTLKPIAKPRIRKRKAKKYKIITIYVVKKLKNGQKTIKPKDVKIPIDLKIPHFRKYVKSGRLIVR
jgi:hypothetical protein